MKRYLAILLLTLFASVAMAGTDVYAPSLKLPADNAANQMPNVTVSWNAVVGSIGLSYELQLDTSSNFNSPQLTDTTLVLLCGYTSHELFFNTKYYWRVRAIDLGQTSGWSGSRSFTVFNQLTQLTPKDKASQDTLSPTQVLTWSNMVSNKVITGVKSFDIEADTNQNFTSAVKISGSVDASKYSFVINNLKFGGKYYWRVRASHNLSKSPWSAVWSFTVAKVIVTQKPANNDVDQMIDALLTWKAIKGILGYEYQLALDQNFTNVVAASEVQTNSVNSQFTMFGTKYYWRVRSRHISDTMQWCTAVSFTTIDKVKLLSPTNNSTGVSMKPNLKWTKQTGIVKYQLQMDIDPNFGAPLIDVKIADSLNSYAVTKKMTNLTQYFWRMRVFSDSQMPDTSGWSDVWNFTTLATGIGDNSSLSSSIYPNPASGKVNVKLEIDEPATLQLSVINLIGSTFIREEFELTRGTNLRELNLSDLSKGVYIIRLNYGGNIVNHKLIIDR